MPERDRLPFGVTHDVVNQPPPLENLDLYAADAALRDALHREGGGWAEDRVAAYGRLAGGELMDLGEAANVNRPELRLFDRYGHRLDEVTYHPAYHQLMAHATSHGVHSFAWANADRPGAHVARAGLFFLHNQAENGTSCPLTMTYACVPVLAADERLATEWLPRVTALEYDPRSLPAAEKRACLVGMGMTEKQGGSDVRANTTRATSIGDGLYELVGHKWFFSAPMCDAFLVLAVAEGGLTCFLLPRFAPGGERNAIRIQRLKDKLGNWSNASSEVEFHGAVAWRVGDEGRGVATILEMVALTRLDCMVGSAGIVRQALMQAIHHARHRAAFGKRLVEQKLMQNVLADIVLESEAATALSLRIARAVDASPRDPRERALARIATAIGKYWVCKRTPAAVNEAQECLGGAGYVEESILPRLYREAPLNSIWEGCGNIQALDVLRALGREPETRDAFFAELDDSRGAHPALDREASSLRSVLDDATSSPAALAALEVRSRSLVERMALALQASILLRAGTSPGAQAVAEAFTASRLDGDHGLAFGTLPPGTPFTALIDRALP
jgi:putative acyl-CoA dehydrogenase